LSGRGKLKFETWKINDRKIRIFGDAAVITQEEQYTNAYSGATEQVQAARKEDVLKSLSSASAKLREIVSAGHPPRPEFCHGLCVARDEPFQSRGIQPGRAVDAEGLPAARP
jgi:hypothetical protein